MLFTIPPLEFAASWLKRDAARHSFCAHPTGLACMLYGRMREVAERHSTKELSIARMGLGRKRGKDAA